MKSAFSNVLKYMRHVRLAVKIPEVLYLIAQNGHPLSIERFENIACVVAIPEHFTYPRRAATGDAGDKNRKGITD